MLQGFTKVLAEASPPPATMLVPPSAFHALYEERPSEAVCVGIRTLSERDAAYCRGEAIKKARAFHGNDDADELVDTFNAWMMMYAVVRGVCDPNDVREPWDVWGLFGDERIDTILSTEGVKMIYDEVERVRIATSPVRPMADDEDIARLCKLAPTALLAMPSWQAGRARRLLAFVLEECEAAAAKPSKV